MATVAEDNVDIEPWEIFTGLRYDPTLEQSIDPQQLRSDGSSSPFYLCDYHRLRLLEAAEFFGWTECIENEILRDLSTWEACLAQHVREYQAANQHVGISSNMPLKVRIALVSPAALRESNGVSATVDTGSRLAGYLDIIRRHPEALSSGVYVTIVQVPEQPLTQLLPVTLDMSIEAREALTHFFSASVDTEATAASPYTYFKTVPRTPYDAASARVKTWKESEADHLLSKMGSSLTHAVPSAARHAMQEVILFNPAGSITEGSITNIYFQRAGQWVTPSIGPAHGGLAGIARRWALESGLCVEGVVARSSVQLGEEIWLSNGVRGFVPGRIVRV